MKKRLTIATTILAALTLTATSCVSDDADDSQSDLTEIEAPTEVSPVNDSAAVDGDETLAAAERQSADLSQAEIDGLVFMREEEKLAFDVYRAMFELWDLKIFDKISEAEQSHTDAVRGLLEQYGIEDPAQGLDPGEFSNPDLQALYDDLVASGSQSSTDALLVGALIEELDITDLRLRASEIGEIDQIYENLERGSRNHLRAFIKQLDRRDVGYTPIHLDAESFTEITTSATEKGQHDQQSEQAHSGG